MLTEWLAECAVIADSYEQYVCKDHAYEVARDREESYQEDRYYEDLGRQERAREEPDYDAGYGPYGSGP